MFFFIADFESWNQPGTSTQISIFPPLVGTNRGAQDTAATEELDSPGMHGYLLTVNFFMLSSIKTLQLLRV